jgi:uncharacterized SAM-binding protein YcdF (DUF218 family)
MKIFHCQAQANRFLGLASCTIILVMVSIIPVQLAVAYYQSPRPQAILTLGGGSEREEYAAQLASIHPSLNVWVSSGLIPKQSRAIFRGAGIPDERVHIDIRAVDTVTNFTTLVDEFKRYDIQHVYLITSDFHMPRAKAIATIILGWRGIAFTPITVPSDQPTESWLHILRDTTRALLWIVTGRTGASLNPRKLNYEV